MGDAPAPILVVSGPSGAGKTTVGRLLAATFDKSAHIQTDHFRPFVVNGWVDSHVLGGAVAAAALQFAVGGYTVVLDGHLFPEGLDGLVPWTVRRGVPLHYAVLRPDLATCWTRAGQRRPCEADDLDSFARLHARFSDLGDREANVVEAMGTPDEVAAAVLAAFSSGRLRVGETGPVRPSLFEFAGGEPAFLALAAAHHARCLADPELNHPFSHPDQHPQHVERLAAYWAEVMGGPPVYSETCGDHSSMLQMHAGNGDMTDLGRRFLECFVAAADDAGLPGDPEFRAALRAYLTWAVSEVLVYGPLEVTVPEELRMPHWSWDGLVKGPS